MWTAIVLLAVLVVGALVVSRLLRRTPFEGRPLGCGCGDGLWRGRNKAMNAIDGKNADN